MPKGTKTLGIVVAPYTGAWIEITSGYGSD